MGKRVPGLDHAMHRALWRAFVKETFAPTNFFVHFNGRAHPVYRDGKTLLVLDEWHGELELLEPRGTAGPARYLGIWEIDEFVDRGRPRAMLGRRCRGKRLGRRFDLKGRP